MPQTDMQELETDYIIIGGGAAGALLARRLAESLPVSVLLIEAGPSDETEERAGEIRRWDEMIYSEYDQDYRCISAGRGNKNIRQSRMHILGGCTTTNSMIMWRPLPQDIAEWNSRGISWSMAEFHDAFDALRIPYEPIASSDQNPIVAGMIQAAHRALDLPLRQKWNDTDFIYSGAGTGFFEVGYDPATNIRSSSSRSYLHGYQAANLHILCHTLVDKILIDAEKQHAYAIQGQEQQEQGIVHYVIRARKEILLCAGAIDSPAILLRSGIGPQKFLAELGIEVMQDLPGVGENLQDHAEGILLWEINRPIPDICASGWDAGLVIPDETGLPRILMQFPTKAFDEQIRLQGWNPPSNTIAITPNIAKPQSRGRIWIESLDPQDPPQIDYGYFTDAAGIDEKILVESVHLARKIVAVHPVSDWIRQEIFPGENYNSFTELSALERLVQQTVYHVSGTCAMGAADNALSVVGPDFTVYGIHGLRIIDASIFPTITAVNPVGMVLTLAELAARLIIKEQTKDERYECNMRH